MPMKSSLFFSFILLIVFFLPLPSLQAQWTTTRLTNNDYDDCEPEINGSGSVVWRGWCDDSVEDTEIFFYNGTAVTRLTENADHERYPRISDSGSAIWTKGDSLSDWGIFLYDGAAISQLSSAYHTFQPSINGIGHVIWQEYFGGDQELFLYNGSSTTQLTFNEHTDRYPQINSSDQFVWQWAEDGSDWEIFFHNGVDNIRLTENDTDDINPRISDSGQVVWVADIIPPAVYLYNGTDTERISSIHQSIRPHINNNDFVVWQEYRYNAYADFSWKIFLHNGSETLQLSDSGYDNQFPRINDNNYVAWQGFDGNDYEIFLHNGMSVFQLTNNSFDDLEPKINNNNEVVWKGFDGTDTEIFLARPAILVSAEPWGVTSGGAGTENARIVEQTDDGGYIACGSTDSFGAGATDIWVLKLDKDGAVQWQQTYGGEGDEDAVIHQTTDGGYIVAGGTDSFGSGGTDFWVLKLDGTGAIQWQKTYGGGDDDRATVIDEIDNGGGYIVAGVTKSFGAGESDIWVLKLGIEGTVQWQHTYGNEHPETVESLQVTGDGGCIVAGQTWSYTFSTNLNSDFLVMKLSSSGTQTWARIYGGPDLERATSVQQTGDGAYIVVGHSTGNDVGDFYTYTWLLKLDAYGDVMWNEAYGSWSRYNHANSIRQTYDGGYIMTGHTNSGPSQDWTDSWLIKLDSLGDIVWQKGYGGQLPEKRDWLNTVRQTSDGGYISSGATESSGMGEQDFWILKFDETGEMDDCVIVKEFSMGQPDPQPIVSTESAPVSRDITGVAGSDTLVSPAATSAIIADACSSLHIDGIVRLPATGQTVCYTAAGSVTDCAGTGQDGEYQMGYAWPRKRFIVNEAEGTVTDHLTGLIWARDALVPDMGTCSGGKMIWPDALDYVACLNSENYLGHADWRLPNAVELWSLTDFSCEKYMNNCMMDIGFTSLLDFRLFSSTSWPSDWISGALATHVDNHGSHGIETKSSSRGLIPVRGPESPGTVVLPATNQKRCYSDFDNEIACAGTGQDGELQTGVAWPVSRFATNIDSTVTDLLTGLVWTQNAGADAGSACLVGGDSLTTWQEALDYAACLNSVNYLGYDDWRLPNVVELRSLLDVSEENPTLPPEHPFISVNMDSMVGYWTSSTNSFFFDKDEAWWIFFGYIHVGPASKTYEKAVWPVRGGVSVRRAIAMPWLLLLLHD